MGVAVRKTGFAGHLINVRVEARVIGDHRPKSLRPYAIYYRLEDERGEPVPLTLDAKRQRGGARGSIFSGGISFPPGESVRGWHLRLDELFDTSLPGRYRLHVTLAEDRKAPPSFTATSGFFEIREKPAKP